MNVNILPAANGGGHVAKFRLTVNDRKTLSRAGGLLKTVRCVAGDVAIGDFLAKMDKNGVVEIPLAEDEGDSPAGS